MRRFFFHYREGGGYTADDSGVEFENFETAYLDAFEAAGEMWPELMTRRVDPRLCSFEISDDRGNMLAILNFKELLENCGSSKGVPASEIRGAIAGVVETAHRARQKLCQLQREIQQTRTNLSALREKIASIG